MTKRMCRPRWPMVCCFAMSKPPKRSYAAEFDPKNAWPSSLRSGIRIPTGRAAMADAIAGPKKAKAKGRKLGRNSGRCKAYRDRGQREKNRKRRIAREARRLARLKREPAHTRRAEARAANRIAARYAKATALVNGWKGVRPADLVDEARTALVHAQAFVATHALAR